MGCFSCGNLECILSQYTFKLLQMVLVVGIAHLCFSHQFYFGYFRSTVFPNPELFISLKKSFSKLFFAFFLGLCLYQLFLSNIMFLCTFSKNFLHVQHILFYHTSLLQTFQTFQFSFFLVIIVNYCEVHVTFRYLTSTSRKYPYHTFQGVFYEIFIKFRFFPTHLKPPIDNFYDIAFPYKLTSKYLMILYFYHNFSCIFIIFYISMNIVTFSTFDTFFYH